MPTIKVTLPGRVYPIVIERGVLGEIGRWMDTQGLGHKVAVISNPWVAERYGPAVLISLRDAGRAAELLTVPPGEGAKTLAEAERLYMELARLRLDRRSVVVALGGGVVGDLAGFVAATYLRGIDYVQVPTTLLAQVDASVGGKTAVDLPVGKNLVGAFHQPSLVIADVDTLATLPPRELRAGLAEVIKYGVIADAALFARLEEEADAVLAADPAILIALVQRSCEIKAEVVIADERETGLRAILNFGHTVGHAVEALTGYSTLLHGEAVAIGMVAAARMAVRQRMLAAPAAERLRSLIERYALPTEIPATLSPEAILETMQLDKKTRDGQLQFVLPTRIGAVEIGCAVTETDARAVLAGAP
jgi:3-dehydroquinate synthase